MSMTLELLVEAYIPGGNQLDNPEKLMRAIIIKKQRKLGTMSLMGREDKKMSQFQLWNCENPGRGVLIFKKMSEL